MQIKNIYTEINIYILESCKSIAKYERIIIPHNSIKSKMSIDTDQSICYLTNYVIVNLLIDAVSVSSCPLL